MLLHEQCRPVTLDADKELLSKGAFLVSREGVSHDELWWSLDFLYDKFKAHGAEKRTLYKWVQFLKQKAEFTEFCNEEFFCQTKQVSLPQNALRENVATTAAILAFLFFSLKESRTPKTVQLIKDWIAPLCGRVCSTLSCSVSIDIEDMPALVLSPAGLIKGIENTLTSRHRTCFLAWQKEWQSMCAAGVLNDELVGEADSAVSLQELVLFAF
ncbi:unnamed protein product [Cladocopium goreaui]|uniref:Uncharacterized protein n=1 Tax=Cladocopium goreaui TaxID=2562237 RepID=A0A9P1CXH3_9DINO|nr:unnamed protein product [Cladocopium goreaui]